MKARANGKSTNSSNANGKKLMSKEDFFNWCKDIDNMNVFLGLYFDWMNEGFPLGLAPSVDRVDPNVGYIAENLQWLSFEENCRKNNINPIDHSEGGW